MATGLALNVSAPTVQAPWGPIGIGTLVATGTITPEVLGPTIANGANSITVPANATGFVFVPPVANTFSLTLKGVSGDTGISLPKTTFSVFLFDPTNPPSTIVITAGGAVGLSQIIFF